MATSRPQLLDSTLREGEQTTGVTFRPEAKLKIARGLDAFGIDYLEIGHPAVSQEVAKTVKQIANAGLDAETLAHSRARIQDVDLARACDVPWVGIFHAVRDEALRERFNIDLPAALDRITAAVEHAKAHGLKVRFTPEDTTRTSHANLDPAVRAAAAAGADRISIADTTGSATPDQISGLVRMIQNATGCDIHVHCHNDLGLATANAFAGIQAGARVVDVTVNGLGERVGIPDLATMALLLTHHGHEAPWDLTRLPMLAETVSEASGIAIHPQAPVVGAHAFSHKAGLHVAAVARDPSHFEAFPPQRVGRRREITVDRYAGTATLEHKCRSLNIPFDPALIQRALVRIKDQDRSLDDAQFRQILEECREPARPERAMAV